jgi:hypothetical protein
MSRSLITWSCHSVLLHTKSYRGEDSVLPLAHPKGGGQRAAQGALDAGTTSSPAGFVAYRNLKHTNGTAHGTTPCSPSNTSEARVTGGAIIMNDAASVLKGLAQRCLEAPCAMPFRKAFLSAEQYHQVCRQNQPWHLARGLPPRVQGRWSARQSFHYPVSSNLIG